MHHALCRERPQSLPHVAVLTYGNYASSLARSLCLHHSHDNSYVMWNKISFDGIIVDRIIVTRARAAVSAIKSYAYSVEVYFYTRGAPTFAGLPFISPSFHFAMIWYRRGLVPLSLTIFAIRYSILALLIASPRGLYLVNMRYLLTLAVVASALLLSVIAAPTKYG